MDVKTGSMNDETRNVDFEIADSAKNSKSVSGKLIDLISRRRSPNFVMNEDGSFTSVAHHSKPEESKFTAIVQEYKRNNPSSVAQCELVDRAGMNCATNSDYREYGNP